MQSRRQFVLASATVLAGCAGARRPDAPAVVEVPGAAAGDWDAALPQSQGLEAGAVAAALDAGATVRGLRSLLVVRHGALVAERYYGGASVDDVLGIHSVTKSVSSMLVGQAVASGAIPGVRATLRELLPDAVAGAPASAGAGVSLEQILTGRTGLRYDWSTQGRAMATAADPVRFALDLPAEPGAAGAWSYNDAAVHLLSPILARARGTDMAALASRDLFAPLGIRRFAWQRDRTGLPFAHGGAALRPRDLIKLPWVMLEGGRWQGRQVLPAAWVADSLRSRGPASWRVNPVERTGYGYLWFTGSLQGQPVMWGWGYGGQFALLAPSLRLAVATNAVPPPLAELGNQTDAIMGLVGRIVDAAA